MLGALKVTDDLALTIKENLMSVEVTYEDIIGACPEFTELADTVPGQATIETTIELAETFVCVSKWGDAKAKKAIIYLTAHFLKELGLSDDGDGDTSVTGPVVAERVGDLSRNYASLNVANASTSDQLLMTTTYGKLFVMLRKTLAFTPLVT